ncbi:MAG: hypothetical protein RSE41_02585 [Clostridia bacterium]
MKSLFLQLLLLIKKITLKTKKVIVIAKMMLTCIYQMLFMFISSSKNN